MAASRNNCRKLARVVFLVTFSWILADYQCTCFGLPRFQSVPTTVKTFENNTVTLPCLYAGVVLPFVGFIYGEVVVNILIDLQRNRTNYLLPPVLIKFLYFEECFIRAEMYGTRSIITSR